MRMRLRRHIRPTRGPYLPNSHLCWLYGWFGCLRADRPVMAGKRARMPAHRALRALPARRPERYRGRPGSSPPAPASHSAGADHSACRNPAGGASLFRKLDIVAVPTARWLPAPRHGVRDLTQIPRRPPRRGLPRLVRAVVLRRCAGTHRTPGSSSSPAIRRPAGPGPPPAAPVTSTSPLTRALLSVPRRIARQHYNQ